MVRGVVVFERFDDIIELFPLRIFGYDNKEEVKVRINRRYSFEEQLRQHAMGIILMPLQDESIEKRHGDEYIPNVEQKKAELLKLRYAERSEYER